MTAGAYYPDGMAGSEGTQIGELKWPAPHWLPFYETDLVNFGYEQEVVLPVAVTLPTDFSADQVELSALAYWNVCDQICIPGEQRLSINCPSVKSPSSMRTQSLFADARAQLPEADHDIRSIIAVAGERVSLGFESSDHCSTDILMPTFSRISAG